MTQGEQYINGQQYRVNGTRYYFVNARLVDGLLLLQFRGGLFGSDILLIQEELIETIDLVVETITPSEQAREENCWEEYLHYGTINGRRPRTRYTYQRIEIGMV